MSGFSVPRPQGTPWFKIGRIDVTSTLAVVLVGVVGMFASVIIRSLPGMLAYFPGALTQAQIWRLVTWPLAQPVGFWPALALVFLWYFGSDLEERLGRNAMAALFVGIWASMTLATTLVGLVSPMTVLYGLGEVQFAILLLWIAEYPTRRFIFNIPAWAFGAFLLGLNVLTVVAARAWGVLWVLLLSLFGVAVAAKGVGLLSEYSWIPGGKRPPRVRKDRRAARQPKRPTRATRRAASDEERMDDLLGKISAEGLHSLTKAERAELEALRLRRRR